MQQNAPKRSNDYGRAVEQELHDAIVRSVTSAHSSGCTVDNPQTAAGYVVNLLMHHQPDLLIRAAIAAGALRFYSICSIHQQRQDGCERCDIGSYAPASENGKWSVRGAP